MKTYVGSLQRKGKRYYLVLQTQGRQRWVALKTDKLPLARLRAAKIAPRDPDDETAWLEQLVREGESARLALRKIRAKRELTWDNLAEQCHGRADAASSADTLTCHAHWLDLLAGCARQLQSSIPPVRMQTPGSLGREDAEAIVRMLSGRYLSAGRMVAYFRRVWEAVGLDAEIWAQAVQRSIGESRRNSEHYRRLSVEEVAKAYLQAKKTAQPLADMVLIGYSTGLRLSDVAELELSEISLPFLRVCPNKTRLHKPRPLKIPLTDEAADVIRRLKESAERNGSRFLFDRTVRHRPSRRLAAVFRRGGVCKQGTGRASFHSLRATFISMMDDAGVPPHVTDAITGHGGGGMHARYTQPSDEALLAAVAKAIPDL